MGIHDGHRDRMRQRFCEHGLDSFEEHEVLELLLSFAIPRVDTNALAHALIDHFGSLPAVFEAPLDELTKVRGIGKASAMLIRLVPQAGKRYQISKARCNDILNSTEKAGAYLMPHFLYERDEIFMVVCLDAKLQLLSSREMSRGTTNSTDISVRKIVEFALAKNASFVILAHNHTSGIAIPSSDDRATTLQIKSALNMVGIGLCDHIVVAGDDFVSMRDSGYL